MPQLNKGGKYVFGLSIIGSDTLMSIRSSDIAFTMGAKGPLMDKVRAYNGTIPQYRIIDEHVSTLERRAHERTHI